MEKLKFTDSEDSNFGNLESPRHVLLRNFLQNTCKDLLKLCIDSQSRSVLQNGGGACRSNGRPEDHQKQKDKHERPLLKNVVVLRAVSTNTYGD